MTDEKVLELYANFQKSIQSYEYENGITQRDKVRERKRAIHLRKEGVYYSTWKTICVT